MAGIRSTKRSRGRKHNSLFRKTIRAERLSQIRRKERDRVSKRLSSLLDPDSDKRSRGPQRRKRGPKKFKKTLNVLQKTSSTVHKADVLRRELERVRRSLVAVSRVTANVVDFFRGSSNIASASLIVRK